MLEKRSTRILTTWLVAAAIAVAAGLLIRARRQLPAAAADGTPGPSFRYDLSAVRQVDPRLVIGEEQPAMALPVTEAQSLAVGAAGQIYVGGRREIAVLDPDGRILNRMAVPFPVRCLVVDEDGTLFAGHPDHLGVYVPGGEAAVQGPALGTNAVLTSVAVAGTNVWVADAGNRVVWRLDRQGHVTGRIDGRRAGQGGFVIPSPHFDLAVGTADELWVVDPGRHSLIAFGADGTRRSEWARTGMEPEGFSGCCNPTDIAIRPDGAFVTAEKGLVRVKLYTPSGSLIGIVAGPDRFSEDVRGLDLAVDNRGRILVLDPLRNCVRVFEVRIP